MKLGDFISKVEKSYLKYFPNSGVHVNYTKILYPGIDIKLTMAKDKSEVAHGIWQNDMFRCNLNVVQDDGPLPTKMEMSTELPQNLMLEFNEVHYSIAPENKYFAFGSRKLNKRKTKGNADKLIVALDKFFQELRDSVTKDFNSGVIHNEHKELVKKKLGL